MKKKSRRKKERKRNKRNLPEQDIQKNIPMLIRYLGLDEATPNTGTKNKRELMERALTLVKKWESGSAEEWSSRLSLRLNISSRTAKENYLEPLIQEGIVKKVDSRLFFIGLPVEDEEET